MGYDNSVWGSGLKVSDFNSNGIYIFGNIQSVELLRTGEKLC